MTLPLPRPNVQVNPGRLGPPRLSAKERHALKSVEDETLRKTLGELFLAARGNQENFDELAQQFPIQPHNAADAITEQVPAGGETGEVLTQGKEGPEWKEGTVDSYTQGAGLEIIKWELPKESPLTVTTLVTPTLVPRAIGRLGFQFGRNAAGSPTWAGLTTTGGGTGESETFPTWSFGSQIAPTAFPPPTFLSVTRGAADVKKQAFQYFMAMAASGGPVLNVNNTEAIVSPGKAEPSIEVAIPANCIGAWAAIARNGATGPTSRSDSLVDRATGPVNAAETVQGQFDIQQLLAPAKGTHKFYWKFAEASGAEERLFVHVFSHT